MVVQLNDPRVISRLKRFRRGQLLKASELQRLNDAINHLTRGTRTPVRKARTPKVPIMMQFRVVKAEDEHIVCKQFDRLENISTGSEANILVAKPYLLRRKPFETGGVSADRGGITYIYTDKILEDLTADPVIDAAPLEREATDGTDTEDQIIIPSYQENDMIFAMRNIVGGTGVLLTDEEDQNIDVVWLAMNDGRAWAVKP